MEVTHHSSELDRVRANTWHEVNERLDTQATARIEAAAVEGSDVSRMISELDGEWDFDRVLETEASLMALIGLTLGVAVHRRFLALPGFVAAMVLLYGTHGWYPLLPIFRRLNIRSQNEIDREKYALKALRGDFTPVTEAGAKDQSARAAAAWRAVCI